MIVRIVDVYIRHYSDNKQTTAYVEWVDDHNQHGRTEGDVASKCGQYFHYPPSVYILLGSHMEALFARAGREGIPIRGETW